MTVCVSLFVLLLYLWWKLFIQQFINNKKEQHIVEKELNEQKGGVQSKRGRSKNRSPSDSNNNRDLPVDSRERSKSPRSSSRNRTLDFSDDDD